MENASKREKASQKSKYIHEPEMERKIATINVLNTIEGR